MESSQTITLNNIPLSKPTIPENKNSKNLDDRVNNFSLLKISGIGLMIAGILIAGTGAGLLFTGCALPIAITFSAVGAGLFVAACVAFVVRSIKITAQNKELLKLGIEESKKEIAEPSQSRDIKEIKSDLIKLREELVKQKRLLDTALLQANIQNSPLAHKDLYKGIVNRLLLDLKNGKSPDIVEREFQEFLDCHNNVIKKIKTEPESASPLMQVSTLDESIHHLQRRLQNEI